MDDLLRTVLEAMEKGEAPPVAAVARLGDPEPLEAAEAFRHASSLPELSVALEDWVPRAFASAHPGRSAVRLAELVVEGRATGHGSPSPAQLPVLAALLGAGSPFADWLGERPEWSAALAGREASKPPRPVWSEVRDAHRRGLLEIGGRWLLGAPVGQTLRALSDLADGCVAAAVECAAGETGVAAPSVLAWGRFGAREVGLVCPLELLLVDEQEGRDGERAEECALLAERLLEELPQGQEAGLSYTLGMGAGLSASAIVQARPSAVAFWRQRRALHDRGVLVSLRLLSGSSSGSGEFEREIEALLARDAASEAGEQAAWKRPGPPLVLCDRLAPEADLLDGPCGMGVLERGVRGLQLMAGSSSEKSLFVALEGFGRETGLGGSAERVAGAYAWLRRAELALGMLGATTPVMPDHSEGQLAVARCMGYAESDATRALARFLYDWRAVRDQVHETADRIRLEIAG